MAERSYPLACAAKFRYRQPDQKITLMQIDETTMKAVFDEPVRSVTCGQEAVIYDGDVLIGGGRIARVFRNGEDLMEKVRSQGYTAK